MANYFRIFLLIISCFRSGDVVAVVFSGGDDSPQVHVKEAVFLRSIGISAIEKKLDKEEGSSLKVSFVSSGAEEYADIFVELLLLNAEGQILLAVESPFVNGDHTVSYIVSKGHSLIVSIAMPVSEQTKYYKVSFINK